MVRFRSVTASVAKPTVGAPALGAAPPRYRWFTWLPLVTFGIASAVPFWFAARRLGGRARLRQAAVYTAGTVVAVLLGPVSDPNADGPTSTIAGLMLLALMVVGSVQAHGLRAPVMAAVSASPPVVPPITSPASDAAVARALHARQRRQAARALADSDPALARELLIGRPDLPHDYDDGGLVDVNSMSVDGLRYWLGMPPEEAATVVKARAAVGRFSSVEDLGAVAGLDPDHVERLRERAVFL